MKYYNAYENDIAYFIDVEPVIDMEHFALLLLADLARKSPIIFYDGKKDKIAILPVNYKEIIQKIMYAENGWGIKFSKLIDIRYYYEHQLEWEIDLVNIIKKILSNFNKNYIFDIDTETLEISFTQDEIDKIRLDYDEESLTLMDHFSNLVSDITYSRRFRLEQNDIQRNINRDMELHYSSLILKLRSSGIKNPEKYLNK